MTRDDWLLAQLPVGMVQEDFFYRFASIFQTLASTLVDGADNMANLLDLSVSPEPVVRYLGRWIGITAVDASLSHIDQRRIVATCARVLAWRGTRRGLQEFVELMCGGPAEITDSGGVYPESESPAGPAVVTIRVASTGPLPESDFVALVRDEVPANVFLELHVGDRQLLPARRTAVAA